MDGKNLIFLQHGTVRLWAESIIANGPDPDFRVPGEGQGTRCEGLSCYRSDEANFPLGRPEDYAYGQEMKFPKFGSAVILEFEVPEELADAASEFGEVRFVERTMDELRRIWPTVKLTARIIELEPRKPNS